MVSVSNASDPNDCIMVTPSDVEDGSSTTSPSGSYPSNGQLRVYPNGEVRLYRASRENSEVDAEEEDDSELEEEPQSEKEVVTCEMCGKGPCYWETFGEEIWEECQGLKDQGLDNKAVWYHVYMLYTQMRHGVLHCFDHRPLPVCVRGEIMDAFPDPNHTYVGFQATLRDAATDT
jgi:hypothetical protein